MHSHLSSLSTQPLLCIHTCFHCRASHFYAFTPAFTVNPATSMHSHLSSLSTQPLLCIHTCLHWIMQFANNWFLIIMNRGTLDQIAIDVFSSIKYILWFSHKVNINLTCIKSQFRNKWLACFFIQLVQNNVPCNVCKLCTMYCSFPCLKPSKQHIKLLTS